MIDSVPAYREQRIIPQFVHSFERDLGIGVAAPEEVGRAGERSWIVARHEVSGAARSGLKDLEAALGPSDVNCPASH